MRSHWILVSLAIVAMGCQPETETAVGETSPNERSPFDFALSEEPSIQASGAAAVLVRPSRFTEASEMVGIRHVYLNGERGQSLMYETTGGGCGWLDYDGDRHWDLYLNQGGDAIQVAGKKQPLDVLYRNLGGGSYQDVTPWIGIRETGYSQGVAVGDFDNDGFDDVYVTNVGANTLWHNQGDGTFHEVTAVAGVGDRRWSSSAAWGDPDLDGDLDLYVCNYLVYDPQNPRECKNEKGEPRICHPRDIAPWPDEYYQNEGDGTFTPQAKQLGLYGEGGKALAVAIADFTNDGWPDIYVSNDTTANFFFVNQGNGTFVDQALFLGCATTRYGTFQASMGLGVGDFDNNGYLDLYATAFYEESNTLYQNLGPQGFQDITGIVGLHALSMPVLTFGAVMADFNRDGLQELFLANGHIENFPGNPIHKMQPQCFAYDGVRWVDGSQDAGDYFRGKYVGRGVATCDYDGDGDVDMAVVHENHPTAILRNESEAGHWLKFFFRGRKSNRRGIGCRVTVSAGDSTYMQELCGGTSYAVSHQPALIFGLGDWDRPCDVGVRWPSGRTQHLDNIRPNQTLALDEPQS